MARTTFADRLPRARKLMAQGLSRSEIAEYFGITPAAAGNLIVAVRKLDGKTDPANVEHGRKARAVALARAAQ